MEHNRTNHCEASVSSCEHRATALTLPKNQSGLTV
jgi:hypothetical protein